MQPSSEIYFASSNKNKFTEAKKILSNFNIDITFFKCNLTEIQSDVIENIALQKAIDAFALCKKPVIVEDDCICINSLNGFPGPYSSYVFKTIGNSGILNLVSKNRNAKFFSVIVYCDTAIKKIFSAELDGKISKKPYSKGWGYDPIFVPIGQTKTFGQLENKNEISHRFKALTKFARWYCNR